MRSTLNGCDVYLGDNSGDGALVAGRATVAYETQRPGLFVVRSRDEGVRVGPFRERLRLTAVERTEVATDGKSRRVTFRVLDGSSGGVEAGTEVVAICTSGCSSCGKNRW